MSQLKRVELEDGTIIMIEADENVNVPDVNAGEGLDVCFGQKTRIPG